MIQKVYVIRHGDTEWAASGRHTSVTDVALTPAGEAKARDLGRRLARVKFDQVWVSPRKRARQTCVLAGLEPACMVEPELAEWNYGAFEGKTSAEIRATNPEWNLFRDGCPGGESPVEVTARADRVIRRLRGLGGDLAVFTHGHFGRVLAARWIGLPVDGAGKLLLDTASFGILDYEHQKPDAPALSLWNEPAAPEGAV